MPSISAIVPARNEEVNLRAAVRGLAAQPEIAEILVVNDHSTDRTAELALRLADSVPRLRVLEASALPGGWMGKNHAAWVGAQAAKYEWLLFTDADTTLCPGAAQKALADAATGRAALVSYSPEQITGSWGERSLIPFIYCRLERKFDFARVNDPAFPDAAANGQFLMIGRDAYASLGGHSAIRGEVLEDVALARRAKQAGFRLFFARGDGIARTRMYRSFRALWQGWTKNLYPLLGGSRSAMARELIVAIPWLPALLVLAGFLVPSASAEWMARAGVAWFLGQAMLQARDLRRNHYPAWFILYYVPGLVLYAAAVLRSSWNFRRGRVVWKGRQYPAKTV